jgi:hypothetical protein
MWGTSRQIRDRGGPPAPGKQFSSRLNARDERMPTQTVQKDKDSLPPTSYFVSPTASAQVLFLLFFQKMTYF